MFAVFLHVSLFGAIASKRLATSRACGHLRVWGKQNGDCSIEPRGLPRGPFSAAASVCRGIGLPLEWRGGIRALRRELGDLLYAGAWLTLAERQHHGDGAGV